MFKTAIYRQEQFNAAHRLYNPNWSDEQNEQVFGKCNNPNFHGHNYQLIVKIIGYPNPETGYVMDMKYLSDLIKTEIIKKFDHKNLNLDIPNFKHLNPTAENIAFVIYTMLREKIDAALALQIKLYETEANCVEYPA